MPESANTLYIIILPGITYPRQGYISCHLNIFPSLLLFRTRKSLFSIAFQTFLVVTMFLYSCTYDDSPVLYLRLGCFSILKLWCFASFVWVYSFHVAWVCFGRYAFISVVTLFLQPYSYDVSLALQLRCFSSPVVTLFLQHRIFIFYFSLPFVLCLSYFLNYIWFILCSVQFCLQRNNFSSSLYL